MIQEKDLWFCEASHKELHPGNAVLVHSAICGRSFYQLKRDSQLMEPGSRNLMLGFDSVMRKKSGSSVLNVEQLHREPCICLHTANVPEQMRIGTPVPDQPNYGVTGAIAWKYPETE